MKLASRYQRTNLLASFIIFTVSGIAFYVLLEQILYRQIDESLKIEQRLVQNFISKHGHFPEDNVSVEDKIVSFKKVNTPILKGTFRTIYLYDSLDKTSDEFRQLTYTVKVGNQWYEASIATSLEGADGLGRSIIFIALLSVGLILLLSFLSNRLILQKLWQPFYNTLDTLRRFKLAETEGLQLQSTSVDEFLQLNSTLQYVIGKAERDYQVLKEFTENASHELQTPLAIIRSKLDLLIQGENLTEAQGNVIHDAYQAIHRLAHLNQSLLLLAKINNGQFAETETVDLEHLLTGKLQALDSIVQAKKLVLLKTLEPAIVEMHPLLADVLLNNLLSNAIQHSEERGSIQIALTKHSLCVSNTAEHGALGEDNLYKRFHKVTSDTSRIGLGLSIVKNVSDASGMNITYRYDDFRHYFILTWTV